MWTITGFAQTDREGAHTFDTARPEGSDRQEIEALVDLPHAGKLSLWFQVTSLGGCMQYDSKSGAKLHVRHLGVTCDRTLAPRSRSPVARTSAFTSKSGSFR